MNTATIVTCYYNVPSKRTFEEYNIYIINLLLNVYCNIIIFTSNDLFNYFNSYLQHNNRIYIIVKDFDDLELYQKYIHIWDFQYFIDKQKNFRSKFCYIIWNSKLKFLKEAIELNPFHSNKFIWNDIGTIRDSKNMHLLKNYPIYEKISNNKIDIILINDILENKKFFCDEIHFSGAIFGSGINTILKFHDLYYQKFDEYLLNNQFIGCDQQIISSVYLENKELFHIIKPNNEKHCEWFYLNYYYSFYNKYIIFKKSGRLGNALFRYFACTLFCILYDYTYILEEEYQNGYTYYSGVDSSGNDISFIPNNNIEELMKYANSKNEIVAFNTLGFMKNKIDILKSNEYIHQNNNHGIFIKNKVKICDDNNFIDLLFEFQNENMIMDGYFQYDYIFLHYKKQILEYIHKNKEKDIIITDRNEKFLLKNIIDDIILDDNKIYYIVIHLRFGDFYGIPDFIEYEYYEKLFQKIDFSDKKCAIVSEKPKNDNDISFLNNCIKWFQKNAINIYVENNDLITDFHIMKRATILVSSMSTLSWCACYFSNYVQQFYMPNYSFYHLDRKTYFRKPIENTVYFDVSTTINIRLKVIIITLKDYPERIRYVEKLIFQLSQLGIECEIFYGINGNNIKIYDIENEYIKLLYYNFETYYYDNRKRLNGKYMNSGELGCAWSHLTIYKKLINDNKYDQYLVLEDDANLVIELHELYKYIIEIPNDADLCHIGYADWYPFKLSKKKNNIYYYVEKEFFNRTTSYIITKNGAKKLLNYSNGFINLPADDLLSNIYVFQNNFVVYAPEKYAFKEKNIDSIINKVSSISL